MKKISREELDRVVIRLSNQCRVRYWLHCKTDHVVLSILDVTEDNGRDIVFPASVYEADMVRHGFRKINNPSFPGAVFEAEFSKGDSQ